MQQILITSQFSIRLFSPWGGGGMEWWKKEEQFRYLIFFLTCFNGCPILISSLKIKSKGWWLPSTRIPHIILGLIIFELSSVHELRSKRERVECC